MPSSSSSEDEAEPQAWRRHMGFVECGFIAGMNEGGVGEVFSVKASKFPYFLLTIYYKLYTFVPFRTKFGKIRSDLRKASLLV